MRFIETFLSVQGETSFTGLPTFFIRLAACNLRCSWCDTPYSFVRGEEISIEELIAKAEEAKTPNICVTGGEPLLQPDVYPLMERLLDLGFTLSLETGGSLSTCQVDPRVHVILDIKCPGSGMAEKNDLSNIALLKPIDEVKFVLLDERDYLFAKEMIEKYQLKKRVKELLLSPVFGVLDPKELVSWMLRDHLPCRLNLQIHKFIWDPQTKGV